MSRRTRSPSTVAKPGNIALSGHRSSPSVPLAADDDALTAFRRVLANLASTIEDNIEGTIEDIDSEFLHELRVAVRRSRSVMAQSKGVLPVDVRDRYRDLFGWLGQITTPQRDLDVYLLGWAAYVSPLPKEDAIALEPVRAELEARRTHAQRDLAETLRGDAAQKVLHGWHRWLTDPNVVPDRPRTVGPVVAHRILGLQDDVVEAGRAITADSPSDRLHDLRKDTKKLRYMLECFGSMFAAKPRKAFVKQLKALQDNLGEHQDAEVHLAQLRDLARDLHATAGIGPDVLLAMGRLTDHLDRRRQHERDEFAVRFAGYDTKANGRLLERLLRPVARP